MEPTMIGSSVIQSVVEGKRVVGRYDHRFFSAMSLLILIIVLVGFARTYFLAGLFDAEPLPSQIIHIHGAVFTCWILLLALQTSLVSCHRVDIHRRVGIFGACLALLMVALGVLAATDTLKRNAASPHFDAESFYAIPLSELIGFAVPVFSAFALRRRPSAHKRLILIATIAMMTAAFGRWPVAFLLHQPLPAMLCSFSLFAVLATYDFVSLGKIHLATVSGSAFVILVELMSFPVGHTAAWHAFAAWMRS
jgi:hypothetical protein